MKRLYFILREAFFINKLFSLIPGIFKPVVFCYHQIDEKEFEEQMVFLKNNYNIIDLESFSEKLKKAEIGKYCAITIDDCLNYDVDKIVPICLKLNIPLTFFIPLRFSLNNEALPGTYLQQLVAKKETIYLNGKKIQFEKTNTKKYFNEINHFFDIKNMKTNDFEKKISNVLLDNKILGGDLVKPGHKIISPSRVKLLSENTLFSFQSHTYNHETLGLCEINEIESELSISKDKLEAITNKEVNSICYPYGSLEIVGSEIFKIVPRYYKYGFSLTQGVCNKSTDLYFIPRIGIYPGDKLVSFKGKLFHYLTLGLFK